MKALKAFKSVLRTTHRTLSHPHHFLVEFPCVLCSSVLISLCASHMYGVVRHWGLSCVTCRQHREAVSLLNLEGMIQHALSLASLACTQCSAIQQAV
jgi:ABC-type multidrug transport system permease subunit